MRIGWGTKAFPSPDEEPEEVEEESPEKFTWLVTGYREVRIPWSVEVEAISEADAENIAAAMEENDQVEEEHHNKEWLLSEIVTTRRMS